MSRAEFLNDTINRTSVWNSIHLVMSKITVQWLHTHWMSRHQAMSFEHTMDKFYTLIYAFSVNSHNWMLLFLVRFKNFAQFKFWEITRSSSFLSSYALLFVYNQIATIILLIFILYLSKFSGWNSHVFNIVKSSS